MSPLFAQSLVFVLLLGISETSMLTCRTTSPKNGESPELDDNDWLEDVEVGDEIKADENCNDNSTTSYTNLKNGYIPVRCGDCQIYDLEVKAWTDSNRSECYGLTSGLLSSSLDCVWKNNCDLLHSDPLIVWSVTRNRNNLSCVGDDSTRIDMNYSCLDPAIDIQDMIDNSQSIEMVKGLIRSHKTGEKYPRYRKRYTMDISPPDDFRRVSSLFCVKLFVDVRNIARGDRLSIVNKNTMEQCEVSKTKGSSSHVMCASGVQLVFNLRDPKRKGKGFDICFHWFNMTDVHGDTSFSKTKAECTRKTKGKRTPVTDSTKGKRTPVTDSTKGKRTPVTDSTKRKTDIPTVYIIRDIETKHSSGIIRSHASFPWNYPRHSPDAFSESADGSRKPYIYSHVLLSPKSDWKLRIHINRFYLDQSDELQIKGDGEPVSVKNSMEGTELSFSSQTVTLNFSVRYSKDHWRAGFLLCYQWTKPDNTNNSKSKLCDQFGFKVAPLCGTHAMSYLGMTPQDTKNLRDKCNLHNTAPVTATTAPPVVTTTRKKRTAGGSTKKKGKK